MGAGLLSPTAPVQLVAENKVEGRRPASVHERLGSETETLLDFARATGDPRGPLQRGGDHSSHVHGPRVPSGPRARMAAFGRAGRGRQGEGETEMRALKKIQNKVKPNPAHATVKKQRLCTHTL